MLEKILVDLEAVNRQIKKLEHRIKKANEEIQRIRSLGHVAAGISATEKDADELIRAAIQLDTF